MQLLNCRPRPVTALTQAADLGSRKQEGDGAYECQMVRSEIIPPAGQTLSICPIALNQRTLLRQPGCRRHASTGPVQTVSMIAGLGAGGHGGCQMASHLGDRRHLGGDVHDVQRLCILRHQRRLATCKGRVHSLI
jgi:hypothetical protein